LLASSAAHINHHGNVLPSSADNYLDDAALYKRISIYIICFDDIYQFIV